MKKILFFAAAVIAVFLLTKEAEAGVKYGDDMPVSRALAAKMLAFISNDKSSIDLYERIADYSDSKAADWFDRYINACLHERRMEGTGAQFKPESSLTLEQAQILLSAIDKKNSITLDLNNDNRTKAISLALWAELYRNALRNAAGELDLYESYGISEEVFVVLATSGNNKKLPEWNLISTIGPLTHHGIDMDGLIDKEIRALVKDGEIIAVLEVTSDTPTLKNCYVVSKTSDKITVFIGGAERSFRYYQTIGEGRICDITISGGEALLIITYADELYGTVKRISADRLELDDGDSYSVSPGMTVYSLTDGAVKWKKASSILIGSDGVDFIMKEGLICSAIIRKTKTIDNIRVLLSVTGFSGYIHDYVQISSDKPFTVETKGSVTKYAAGDVFELSKPSALVAEDFARITVTPSEGGRLALLSVKRAWEGGESPKYRGAIEIGLEADGYSLVNELPFEEYLYAVVPSEMPTSHGLEAAKVQAVSARSYAYNQYFQNKYSRYGANVDDSVLCQVYNNIPENETSVKAVDETAGLCLVYNGEVISANFFSTSAGVTANAGEVWAGAGGRQFPAPTKSYLSAVTQLLDGSFPDMKSEAVAHEFFVSAVPESYDSGYAWYRWNVEMSTAELSDTINRNLNERYNASPPLIKTLQEDGTYKSAPISTIGTLKDIEVTKRGQGGNIMELRISGSKAVILVQTEYNIRCLLRPVQADKDKKPVKLVLANGSVLDNYQLMPSAFFCFDKATENSKLSAVKFFGGGMGHGVGMSQNGVKGLVDQGKSYIDILKHYYAGTDVAKVM